MFLNSDFSDPTNREDFHKLISEISNEKEAIDFAKSLKTEDMAWIEDEIDDFMDDLTQLKENWRKICQMVRQERKKIIIVNRVILNNHPSFTIISAISEILTRCGYCVRGKEFKKCKECKKAFLKEDDEDCCKDC